MTAAERALAMSDRALELLRRPWVTRTISLGLAAGIGAVFTLASLLVPSPDGHGTHLQLGLGQCTFLAMTGWPCPMCGATTTFTLLAHLRPVDGLVNQPFAALLFAISAVVFGIAISEAVDPRGRWGRLSRWLEPRETLLAGGFLVFMALSWAYKAATMGLSP